MNIKYDNQTRCKHIIPTDRTVYNPIVQVKCSANWCRFKKNDSYYNECKNPAAISEHTQFGNGRVLLSGCHCQDCHLEDCLLNKHAVST